MVSFVSAAEFRLRVGKVALTACDVGPVAKQAVSYPGVGRSGF